MKKWNMCWGRASRFIVLSVLSCFVLTLPTNVLADYSPEFKMLKDRHSAYNLDFSSAPVVHQKITTTREEAISRLQPMIEELIEKELSSKNRVQDIFCDPEFEQGAECDNLEGMIQSLINKSGSKSFSADKISALRNEALSSDKATFQTFTIEKQINKDLVLLESESSTTLNHNKVFDLTVANHGHAFSFTNHLANYGKYANAEAYISEAKAEEIGRQIIAKYNLIPKEMRDQLVFARTRYVHFTGQMEDPGDRIVSTEIQFGREINGVPVIGPGSVVKADLQLLGIKLEMKLLIETLQLKKHGGMVLTGEPVAMIRLFLV